VATLNQIHSPEGLEVYFEGAKPRTREMPSTLPTSVPASSEQAIVPDFKQLTGDENRGNLSMR